jgi:branched-chain amino acid transport system ATP-binding protein
MMSLIDLHVGYGPIEVLKGVSVDIREGRITCLVGANGAGKSTTLNAISGLVRPRSGEIRYVGKDIAGLPPEQVIRLGVVQVPEGRRIFRNLTVHECLRMGGLCRRDKAGVAADIELMYERFPRLRERSGQLAGTLSGGEQQMLAFGRALVARPRLLLLDEPSMGLAPTIVQSVAELICTIRDQGVTVLLVEQNAELALGLADFGYVMETGQITLSGDATKLLGDPRVRETYLGI